ncbi:MAG TPA: site-2 protease family protein [Sporichthyaceae bacterium]|nr:site-2 protease family protein [Sporichthyaceae bacterium]
MLTAIGVVLFVVLLLFSVAVHEFGHLLTAKHYGMKATEYFIGFGPKLWSFRRGETEYGLKAIPAGGYVRIIGMADTEVISQEDQPRAFHRFPARKRQVVLVAGSVSHMFLAFALFFIALVGFGTSQVTTTVGSVAPCLPAAGATGCTATDPASPAAAAGLRPGDTVLAVGTTPIRKWDEATALIRAHGAGPIQLTVRREGRELTLTPDLVARDRPDPDHPDRILPNVGVLGVNADSHLVHDGPIAGAKDSAILMRKVLTGSVHALFTIPNKIPNLVDSLHGGHRDRAGLVGVVGAARISGETLNVHEVSLSERIGAIFTIIGGLNIFIGLFNVLPLPPLDGGHMAVVGYESLRRRRSRRLGHPDPGRVPTAKLLPATYVFLLLAGCLTVLLIAADIINPVTLN